MGRGPIVSKPQSPIGLHPIMMGTEHLAVVEGGFTTLGPRDNVVRLHFIQVIQLRVIVAMRAGCFSCTWFDLTLKRLSLHLVTKPA